MVAWVQMFLDFLAKVAWPAVVVVLAVVFRRAAGRFLEDLQEFAYPGGHFKRREGDRRVAEVRSESALSPEELRQSIARALELAEESGANRARAEDRITARRETIRDAGRSIRDVLELYEDPPTKCVALAGSFLKDFFGEAHFHEDMWPLSDDPLLPDSYRARLLELIEIANDAIMKRIEVSDSGCRDYLTKALHWISEYDKYLDAQLTALGSPSNVSKQAEVLPTSQARP